MQRPRDRRRARAQHVDLEPQLAQELLLGDAEALLLVDDHEPELLRDHVAREDAVRPDQDVDLALAELGQHALHLGAACGSARPSRPAPGSRGSARGRCSSAAGRGSSSGTSISTCFAGDGDGERGAQRDLGLAEADVAADEPVHRTRRLEILLDRLDRARLVFGLAVRELGLEPLDPLVVDVVGDAGPGLALGVELRAARRPSRADARARAS